MHRVPVVGDEEERGSMVQAAMISPGRLLPPSPGRLLPPSECLPVALEVCRETQEEEGEKEEELVMLMLLLLLLLVAQFEEGKEAEEEGKEAETVGKVAQVAARIQWPR